MAARERGRVIDFTLKGKSKGKDLSKGRSPQLDRVNWVPNSLTKQCYCCETSFSLTNRKHHCRECGNVVCNSCSSHKMALPARGFDEPVRVCIQCYHSIVRQRMQENLTKDDSQVSTSTLHKQKQQELDDLLLVELVENGIQSIDGEELKLHLANVYFHAGEQKNFGKIDSEESRDIFFLDEKKGAASLEIGAQLGIPPFWNGTLIVTNFRVCFLPYNNSNPPPSSAIEQGHAQNIGAGGSSVESEDDPAVMLDAIWVPLLTIRKLETSSVESKDLGIVELKCQDCRVLRFGFLGLVKRQRYAGYRNAVECLKHYINPHSPTQVFAFRGGARLDQITSSVQHMLPLTDVAKKSRSAGLRRNKSLFFDSGQSWTLYQPVKEYERMRISPHALRFSQANRFYELADTYPNLLVVPQAVSDEQLHEVAKFRSKGRLPVMTWKDPEGYAMILRSSQPLVGIMGQRSEHDEHLLLSFVRASGVDKLVIADARPSVNAVANTALGAGYENTDHIQAAGVGECHLEFIGIENIHVMRKSFSSIMKVCVKTMETGDHSTWWSDIGSTNHLDHISTIIRGALYITQTIREGVSVLVHCSDGWDRTSQLAALAQVMLDPFYRTMRGFEVLIEKDWLSFGHKFYDRSGLGEAGIKNEISPVFAQWIDCVWQLMHQFPAAFEFNEQFLIVILDAVYSGQYGNFLFNSEKERMQNNVRTLTQSLWHEINLPGNSAQFLNPYFQHYGRDGSLVHWSNAALPSSSSLDRDALTTRGPAMSVSSIGSERHFQYGYNRGSVKGSFDEAEEAFAIGGEDGDLLPDTKKLRLWSGYYLRWEALATRESFLSDRAMRLEKQFVKMNARIHDLHKSRIHHMCRSIVHQMVTAAVLRHEEHRKEYDNMLLYELKYLHRRIAVMEAQFAMHKVMSVVNERIAAEVGRELGRQSMLDVSFSDVHVSEEVTKPATPRKSPDDLTSRIFADDDLRDFSSVTYSPFRPSTEHSASFDTDLPVRLSSFHLMDDYMSAPVQQEAKGHTRRGSSLPDLSKPDLAPRSRHASRVRMYDINEKSQSESLAPPVPARPKHHKKKLTASRKLAKQPLSVSRTQLKSTNVRWVPDDECTQCRACKASFTLLRRRHHCRLCGQIYCSSCSFKRDGVVEGMKTWVCFYCFRNIATIKKRMAEVSHSQLPHPIQE